MKDTLFFIKGIISLTCIWLNISKSTSESISLCLNQSENIKCDSGQRIVITDAKYGYVPLLDRININSPRWCQKQNSYLNDNTEGCVKSHIRDISAQCTGFASCFVSVLPSKFRICESHKNSSYEQSLYIDFDCVYKDLLFPPDQMDKMYFVGGYMTSVGYSLQKSADRDGLALMATSYRQAGHLPIKKIIKPSLIYDSSLRKEFVFQFQILENSLSTNNQSVISRTCQMGELYSQDFYAFTPTNETQGVSLCASNQDMVGQTFGPILTKQITVNANVNFTSMTRRVLLIKFTMIVCPLIVVENAVVTYDHVVHTSQVLSVSGVAIINCNVGFFLLSESSSANNVTSKTLECDHITGLWSGPQRSEVCVNKLVPESQTSAQGTVTIIDTSPSFTSIKLLPISTPYFQLSSTTNASAFVSISSEVTVIRINQLALYIVPPVIIVLLLCALFCVLFSKCKEKSKYLGLFFNLCSKNETLANTKNQAYSKAYVSQSFGHNFIFDDATPMTESLNIFTNNLSPNGSCRQSTRTLTTRVGSRPTIFSVDSMQTSNYMFDSNPNIVPQDEELPTKLPSISTMNKLKKSANSFRKSSFAMLRPNSLSRQSFIDMNSDLRDGKLVGSAIPLLMLRRTSNPPEFMDSNSIMCTSDILPSKEVYLRKKYISRPYSQTDLSFKSRANANITSPTMDTYLEPTESSTQLNKIKKHKRKRPNERQKNRDYVTYDLSRISSNNPDATLQSSAIASLPEDNANDEAEKKRFSMISNNYYGIQDGNPQYSHREIVNSIDCSQYNASLNSDESIYESIDDYPMYPGTIDRRHIALPLLPDEH